MADTEQPVSVELLIALLETIREETASLKSNLELEEDEPFTDYDL